MLNEMQQEGSSVMKKRVGCPPRGGALRVGVDVAGAGRAGVRQAFRVPDKVSAVRDMIVLVTPLGI